MKLIFRQAHRALIYSAKNKLELEGIECFLKNEHTNTSGGDLGISNMFLELWIYQDDQFEKASKIIEEQFENPEIKESWVCPKCNEKNEGTFEICWQCQSEPILEKRN